MNFCAVYMGCESVDLTSRQIAVVAVFAINPQCGSTIAPLHESVGRDGRFQGLWSS